ncbi:hypothetical protein ACQP1P_36070 [Dactylosporangium sp. CA-052675]|uniref:hypothetical protein n=1 Tax=Dactylosporangium sp. CA-052675 TaxID=3239927 RepID=UPI003D8B083B
MEQDLHTLLTSVRDDAPPPRLSVDDITAAGRHLVRRRRRLTLLSSAGGGAVTAIAAVTAVLMLTGAPRALTPAVDPSGLASPAAPAPTAFVEAAAFSTTYQGYKAGPYQVGDPDLVTNAYQQSTIATAPGGDPAPSESESAEAADPVPSAGPGAAARAKAKDVPTGGILVVYRPGAFEPTLFEKGGEKVQLRDGGSGLLAYAGTMNAPPTAPGDRPAVGRTGLVPTLAWQYTGDAWAAIYWSAWENVPDREHLLAIADGLTPSVPRQFPVAFQPATVPRGYQLLSVSYGGDVFTGDEVVSAARLTAKPPALPIYQPYVFEDLPVLTLAVGHTDAGPKLAGRLECDGQTRCTKVADTGKTYVYAEAGNTKLSATLTQLALGIRLEGDLGASGTWPPAAKVFAN